MILKLGGYQLEKWINCEKCGAKLAYVKSGWIEVEGRTNFKSDGNKFIFTCRDKRCENKYIYTIREELI